MTLPDPELAEFASTGAERPFRTLVDRHLAMVLAAASRRLGEFAHLAPDVAQTVFSRLVQRAKALPPGIVLGSWLYCQSQRVAIDMIRSESRRRSRELTAMTTFEIGVSPDSNDRWKQLAPELDEALSKLAARDRDALILRYFEGRDLKAVSNVLGISIDAAQKRVARAVEKLRIRLNARGIATTRAALAGMVNANGSRLPVNTSPVNPGLLASKALKAGLQSSWISTAAIWITTLVSAHLGSTLTGAALAILCASVLLTTGNSEVEKSEVRDSNSPNPSVQKSLISPARGSASRLPDTSTIAEMVRVLNGLLEGPQTYVSKLQQKQLLERLEPEQFLPFLKEMELQITGQARQEGLELLIDTSGGGKNAGTLLIALLASDEGKDGEKLDGSLDLNCVSLSTQRQPTTRGSNRLSDLFMRWLSADAEQAQSWLMANLNHPQLRRAFRVNDSEKRQYIIGRQLVHQMAAHAAHQSISQLESVLALIGEEDRQFVKESFAHDSPLQVSSAKDGSFPPALAGLLQSSGSSAGFAKDALQTWARQHEKAALDWMAKQPWGDANRWTVALGVLVADGTSRRSDSDIASRASAAFQECGQLPRAEALRQIMRTIAPQGFPGGPENPNLAKLLGWLITQGADADNAMMEAARMSSSKPRDALAWAAAISNPDLRDQMVRGIYRKWLDDNPWVDASKSLDSAELGSLPASTKNAISNISTAP